MNFDDILSSLIELGHYINTSLISDNELKETVSYQHSLNNWHSDADINPMLNHLGSLLTKENIIKWFDSYPAAKNAEKRTPVIIKPIPDYSFAAIQEWLCCIATLTPMAISANENQYGILKLLCNKLEAIDSRWTGYFSINPNPNLKTDKYIVYAGKESGAIKQYFSTKKAVVIDPKPTLAIITGSETPKNLSELGRDIFMHLGQTSRTLRKVFIPKDFEIRVLIKSLESYSGIYSNNKYANNYDYHQSVFLMNKISFLDNGFLIFKEDKINDAPTGCLFYEYYDSLESLLSSFQDAHYENLICSEVLPIKTVKPGRSHFFDLWDYPNNQDIVTFLLNN